MKSRLLFVGLGLGAGLALASGFFARPYAFHGSLIEPPVAAPEFSLTDQNGQPFRLSDQRGRVTLLFFGYTSCPDACPATLAQFKQIRAALGRQADRVRFVLITVDPEVDSTERLRDFLLSFDSTFVGLTGTQAELEPVWRNYGVYVEKLSSGEVDHTNRVYAVDTGGNLRLTYTPDTSAEDVAQDVLQLLR